MTSLGTQRCDAGVCVLREKWCLDFVRALLGAERLSEKAPTGLHLVDVNAVTIDPVLRIHRLIFKATDPGGGNPHTQCTLRWSWRNYILIQTILGKVVMSKQQGCLCLLACWMLEIKQVHLHPLQSVSPCREMRFWVHKWIVLEHFHGPNMLQCRHTVSEDFMGRSCFLGACSGLCTNLYTVRDGQRLRKPSLVCGLWSNSRARNPTQTARSGD